MLQAKSTLEWLTTELKLSFDLIEKPLKNNDKEAVLLFIKTLVDNDKIQLLLIKPFFEIEMTSKFLDYLHSLPDGQDITSKEQILSALMKGSVVLSIHDQLFMFDIKKVNTTTVPTTSLENTVLGPQSSLSEDIHTNINLIRQRYHKPALSVEMIEIGAITNQSLAILYDRDLVNQHALKQIKEKVQHLHKPIVQSTAELQRLINGKKYSLFPFMMITERTDRIVYNLGSGKVVLSLDGDASTYYCTCDIY